MTYIQFRLETDADGIVLASWDSPGKSMNLIDETMMRELESIVDATSADASVKGVVIASGLSIGTLFTLFVVPAVYLMLAATHRAGSTEEVQDATG